MLTTAHPEEAILEVKKQGAAMLTLSEGNTIVLMEIGKIGELLKLVRNIACIGGLMAGSGVTYLIHRYASGDQQPTPLVSPHTHAPSSIQPTSTESIITLPTQ